MSPRPPHRQRTLITTKLTELTVNRMSRVEFSSPHVCQNILHTEFVGDLVLVNCCGPVAALAHRMLHEGDVSIIVSDNPDFGERTTRSEVRRAEVSNRQQTNYFGNHEKAPVGRDGGDRAVVVQGQGRTRDGGTAPIGSSGTQTRGGRTSARAKRFRAEEIKELEQNVSVCRPNGKLQVKEVLIRDLLRWCERQTELGTAPFLACAQDVLVDATVGSAQFADWLRRKRTSS